VLVWSLVDVAKPVLSPETQMWLSVKIGAGDQVEAVNDLLHVLACRSVEVPDQLSVPLWDWVSGYLGSDSEPRLRSLLARLRVPEPPRPWAPQPVPRSGPSRERPRRVRHGVARTKSPSRTVHLKPAVPARPLHDSGLRSRAGAAGDDVLVTNPPSLSVSPRRSAS
jgi:hypothetical protein